MSANDEQATEGAGSEGKRRPAGILGCEIWVSIEGSSGEGDDEEDGD